MRLDRAIELPVHVVVESHQDKKPGEAKIKMAKNTHVRVQTSCTSPKYNEDVEEIVRQIRAGQVKTIGEARLLLKSLA